MRIAGRAVGGGPGARPALGEDLGYGLRLRARGTGGTVAPRVRRGIRSAVNCTRDGQRDSRYVFLEWLRLESILCSSSLTEEEAGRLAEEIKAGWWAANKDRFIRPAE